MFPLGLGEVDGSSGRGRRRTTTLAAAVVVALAGGFAVAAPKVANPAAAGGGNKLTVYHWWTSPSEAAAINALVELFGKKYPDVTVFAAVSPQHDIAMFQVIHNLARAGRPPDTFQMDTGYAAQPFFDAGLLSPVDDIWKSEQLEKVVPPVIAEVNRFEGHYYSIPIDVHRMNVVWCNKPLLDKFKIKSASLTTWDEFFKAAETLRAGGVRYPIQMGESWTASHVFEGIMAGLGMPVYEDWINGKITAPDDTRLLGALSIFKRYLGYVNPDHAQLSWDKAVHNVITGDGAFCVMGDWANGEFKLAGLGYGKDYEAIPVPGTKSYYGINVDAFPRPRGLADTTNSVRWLKMAASREGQDAFNALKGSISVRSDADTSKYDAYQRSALADLKSDKIYPTLGQGAPAAFADRLDQITAAFANDRDAPKAAAALAEMTTKLTKKYNRVWSLQ